MDETPFLGELRLIAGPVQPGWTSCDGQLLQISQNQQLFMLIGATFGGDGTSTFALPDLGGRVVVGAGGAYALGEAAGSVLAPLTTAQMPSHSHGAVGASATGTQTSPVGGVWAENSNFEPQYGAGPSGSMSAAALATTGQAAPHPNMQPYLTLTWAIATSGQMFSPSQG